MSTYTAWVTPANGATRRFALISTDRDDALREARLLAGALFGSRGFTFGVRGAA
jgi:hypothetical protein